MKIDQFTKLSLPKEKIMKNQNLAYCRKSSESEDRQMASITSQIDALNTLATQRGIKVTKIFSESRSAKEPGRPQFNEMISYIKRSDNIKSLLCWDTSRLFRNPIDEGQIRWLLDTGKIEELVTPFKTYTKNDSSLLLAVEGGKNQSFIQDLKRNTKRGVDKKVDNGIFPGLAPAGYFNDMTMRQGERDIKPDPDSFEPMQSIFKLALTGRYTIIELTEKAKNLGVKNSRNNPPSKTQMSKYLRNPFYCGLFVYAGKLYQGTHVSMISKKEFDALQDVLDGKARFWKVKHDYPFKGLRCGYCGYQVVGETHTKPSGLVFDHYACTKRRRGLCSNPWVSSKDLEVQINEYLENIKVSNKFIEWASTWLKETESKDRSIRETKFRNLESEHKQIEVKLNSLTDKWLLGQFDDKEYQEHKQRFQQRLAEIDEDLKNTDKDWKTWTDLTIDIFKYAKEAQNKWNVGTVEDKKAVLNVICSNLSLKDKKLEFTARTPFQIIQQANLAIKSQKACSNSDFVPNSGMRLYAETVLGG